MSHHGIDEDVVHDEARKGMCGLAADIQEHAVTDLEHIGLVNDREVLPAAHRKLAGRLCNSLTAMPCDPPKRDDDVRRDEEFAVALLHVAIGVKAFGILPHHHEVKRAKPVMQPRVGSRRPDICKQIEILAKEFGRIDFAALLVLEIKGGGGTQDQTVRGAHDFEEPGANGRAELPQAFVSDRMLLDLHVELKSLGSGPKDALGRGRDLRPDAVARQNDHAHVEFLTLAAINPMDRRPSGVDLIFATYLAANSQSECQIRNSTRNICLLVVLLILTFAKCPLRRDANVRIGPLDTGRGRSAAIAPTAQPPSEIAPRPRADS